MNTTLFQLFSRDITGLHLAVSSGILLFISAFKFYMSGGVCRATRDLTGKTAVITGGNTGIGKETALDLAKQNCDIIIGARDKGKLEEVIKEIRAINPKIKASYSVLDLGDRESIEQFSRFVEGNVDKIDFLINNAGVMMVPQRRETKDGLQMQMGTNHFGHFYLTHLLFPLIKKAEKFRVINVSSRAHYRTPTGIDFDDINHKNSYNDIKVYGQTKLANIYFSRLLQQKIDQSGLNGMSVSLHPGVVRTELTRYLRPVLKALMVLVTPLYYLMTKSAKQGAQTTLHLVYEDESKLTKGEYYADCKVGWSTKISKDMEAAQKLWRISEETWGVKFVV